MAYVAGASMSDAFRKGYPKSRLKGSALNASAKKVFRRTPVRLLVDELRAKQLKRHEISLDRWLAEQAAIAFGRSNDVLDWGETIVIRDPETKEIIGERQSLVIKARKDLPDNALAMIQSLKQTKDGNLEVRFHPKQPALDAIGKHMGWFEKDNRQKGEAEAEALKEGLAPDIRDLARTLAGIFTEAQLARTISVAGTALGAAAAEGDEAAGEPGRGAGGAASGAASGADGGPQDYPEDED
jgi:phage terminase small subunit